MKKKLVLAVLFVLPLVVYLFFASGVTQFGHLPVLGGPVPDLTEFDTGEQLEGKITVLGFPGSDIENWQGNAFNLNQKIYKPFYEFHDFQMLILVPEGTQEQVAQLRKELDGLEDSRNWRFVFGEPGAIRAFFESLGTDLELGQGGGTPYVFILDKDRMLRGRTDDEDEGTKFGFNATSVADLNNKMKDDVKIILAEYRLALKKNQARQNPGGE